jgi:two-component system sensor histidine kinase/response regulator
MIQVVIRNLLSNAIKFSHKGSSIEIGIKQDSNNVQLSVKDTGKGIEPERIHKIFVLQKTSIVREQMANQEQGLD